MTVNYGAIRGDAKSNSNYIAMGNARKLQAFERNVFGVFVDRLLSTLILVIVFGI